VIRAAGGLVVRDDTRATEVLVVHRPRYDDWTFPKGKAKPGETDEDCAVREVEEETGLVCELGEEVASARYVDARGRLKEVRYWVMHVVDTHPWAPNDEVDRRLWASVDDAAKLLSYEHDRELLATFARSFTRRPPS
jgi:8-oxo-dGTP pyrophosphatase MutT (NUDIX family)